MRTYTGLIICILLTISGTLSANQFVPIVLVHGAFSTEYDLEPTAHYIRKYMGNDVYIKNIRPPAGVISSIGNIYKLVKHMRKQVESDPHLKNGFNIIAHSQGGLVSRYYIERYNNPQVLTYISWGSPQQGILGFPGKFEHYFKWLDRLEGRTHNILYSWPFQKYVSFAGYWHDTVHYEKYLKKSCFLPYVNNEIDHEHATQFKDNICKLKNMVLVMSHDEDIVEPAISCHFGFYKKGSNFEEEKIFDTEMYKKDTLGLKTLYESGRLHLRFASCPHVYFPKDEKNFVENTLEYLKADPDSAPLATVEQPEIAA